jgi:hypothetical protein
MRRSFSERKNRPAKNQEESSESLALAGFVHRRYDRPIGVEPLGALEKAPRTSAMTARTGLTLRLVGPLIEVVCLILLLKVRDQGRQFLGLPVEYPLYAGLALGLILVIFERARRSRLKGPSD